MLHRLLVTIVLVSLATPAFTAQETGNNDARVQDLYSRARTEQSHGDLAAAIASYEEILRLAPRLGPAYNNLGALYFRQREYKKAAGVLEQGLKIDPGMASASALLGISYYEMGEYAKARPALEAALHANPSDSNAQMFLVKDLNKLGDNEAAAGRLSDLARREPKNQEVWYLLAKIYMTLSEKALARMNAIDPNSFLAHELSAEVMESMNNYEGAIVELKKAVDTAPKQPGTHYKLGDAYWSLSKWDSASEQFQAELAIDPGNCHARWKIGDIVLQKNGAPGEALAGIDKALAMCPELTDARVDRARALMKLNRNEEAVKDLEAAVKADPAEPTTHFLLSKAYRLTGHAEQSQAEMRTFSKLEESARAATAERAREVIQDKETAH